MKDWNGNSISQFDSLLTEGHEMKSDLASYQKHLVLETLLADEKIPYFKMGSRRFGWENALSDYDYCVLADDKPKMDYVMMLLKFGSFTFMGANNKYINAGNGCLFRMKAGYHEYPITPQIDVVVIENKKEYAAKREQHERLEKLVNSKLANILKSVDHGPNLYRLLVKELLEEEAI